jgi:hypothetical protein
MRCRTCRLQSYALIAEEFQTTQYLAFCNEVLPRNPGGKILKKVLRNNVDWGKPVW